VVLPLRSSNDNDENRPYLAKTSSVYRISHPEQSKYRKTAGRPGLCPNPNGELTALPRPPNWWGGS